MAPSSPLLHVARPARGVRRRRGDETIEIEALDAQTMRQNSYNYFQQPQPQQQQPQQSPRLPTFRSSLRRSSASRKRQRTLAEQMEGLTLARDSSGGDTGSRFVELDEHGRERATSDPDDSGEDDEASDGDQGEMLVYGGVPNAMRRFFEPARRDRRPLDRIYRHYISLAAQHHRDATDASGKELVVFHRPPGSLSLPPGDPASRAMDMTLPRYLSITPQDFQRLSTEEKRQWYQMHMQYLQDQERENRREGDLCAGDKLDGRGAGNWREAKATPLASLPSFTYRRSRSNSSASSTGSFHALGVPATNEDDETFAGPGDDFEMMEDDAGPVAYAPRVPHSAGAITHAEWFDDDDL